MPVRHNGSVRLDGTKKGPGFLGSIKRPDGKISTELSIGVNIDGEEIQIPTLVPTLTTGEVDLLINGVAPTDTIIRKVIDHAMDRKSKGLSPFKGGN